MTLMKNVIIDTTLVDKDRSLIALAWGVAQGCGLTNVQIDMPTNSNGHVGISLDGGSTISLSDVVSRFCAL
jgi:glucan 1,3-beta-glucosidase